MYAFQKLTSPLFAFCDSFTPTFRCSCRYYFLETKKWKDNEATTHEMLQKIEGVEHDKLHITKNVKRNVYTIDIKEFEEQKVDLEVADFGVGKDEVPFWEKLYLIYVEILKFLVRQGREKRQ